MSCKCDTINIVNDNNVIVVSHADGRDGKSAYQQAVEGGYTGTEQEFNCSLSLLSDVAEGKKQIADAINTKGGSASADSSFAKLAEDIKDLPIDGILTYGIKFISQETILQQLSTGKSFNNIVDEINDTDGLITSVSSSTSLNAKRSIKLNNVIIVQGNYVAPILEFAMAEELLGSYFTEGEFIQELILGRLRRWMAGFKQDLNRLRSITVGYDSDANISATFKWYATYVIAEGQSGIDELNNNLRTNLLEKLADHSTDGQTRTLRLGWLAHVTQENIDYANSKGWTLTT